MWTKALSIIAGGLLTASVLATSPTALAADDATVRIQPAVATTSADIQLVDHRRRHRGWRHWDDGHVGVSIGIGWPGYSYYPYDYGYSGYYYDYPRYYTAYPT